MFLWGLAKCESFLVLRVLACYILGFKQFSFSLLEYSPQLLGREMKKDLLLCKNYLNIFSPNYPIYHTF